MKRSTILILEDNAERLRDFERAVSQLGPSLHLRTWRDTKLMMAECHDVLHDAVLISLDHDLNKEKPDSSDPGDGLDVARFLARLPAICPVILHTSNTERVWSMHNEFRFGGWQAERVMPLGPNWVEQSWLPMARRLVEGIRTNERSCYQPIRAADAQQRFSRAILSLYGLAIGDGIGEMMFSRPDRAAQMIVEEKLPPGPWWHTDDTEMAISIVEVLRLLGTVHQDALARHFAARFERDPDRGYGSGARRQLQMIIQGAEWRVTSRESFGGQGSQGNGSAMRVAPVGAWFTDDLDQVVKEAHASAMVTHMHREGVAGAVAVAVAAAMAYRLRGKAGEDAVLEFWNEVHKRTPEGETRSGIAEAFKIRRSDSVEGAARSLGNGSGITCPDTVPFTLWCAAKHLGNYRDAIAATASGGGDVDTNCAIVGGIVALSSGWDAIPANWLQQMEPLPFSLRT